MRRAQRRIVAPSYIAAQNSGKIRQSMSHNARLATEGRPAPEGGVAAALPLVGISAKVTGEEGGRACCVAIKRSAAY